MRADVDAPPVAEEVDLPFASGARSQWGGAEAPLMHACGHDCHTAILMAVGEVLRAGFQNSRASRPATRNMQAAWSSDWMTKPSRS